MDSPPPPPPPPAPYVATSVYSPPAATNERPRTKEEQKLCEKASHVDWLYLGTSVLLTAGAIAFDDVSQSWGQEGLRYLGPASVGLTWGFTLGGGYLALPKCSPDYVTSAPPEGDIRSNWEIPVIFAALAGLTAPVIVATVTGTDPASWSNAERASRLVLAGGLGVGGALLPYLLPPQTWRAARELANLRASTTENGRGAFVSWSVRF